jgi:hypothetical protein
LVRNIQRFVDKKFLYTVDLDLLGRFLEPYRGEITLDLDALSDGDEKTRPRLFEWFTDADESYPSKMLDNLHRMCELSTEAGVRLLRQRAELTGVEIIPAHERDNRDGMHLNPRYVALRAFLDHPKVFDEALDWLAFYEAKSPGEFVGTEENVAPVVTKESRTAFEAQASKFFNERYKGKYCKVHWYPDGSEVSLIVIHGKDPVSTLIIEDDEERPLAFREMKQDTVTYDQHTGRAKVSATTEEEKAGLCTIFAETILRRPSFFDHDGATRLYTLDPIRRAGAAFQFNGEWDSELIGAAVTEVQIKAKVYERELRRRKRSAWAATIRDSRDAIGKLFEMCPSLDLQDVDINYVRIRFAFLIDGKTRRRTVRVQPPGVASFNRTSLESKIMEHLRRNGFCIPRRSAATSA